MRSTIIVILLFTFSSLIAVISGQSDVMLGLGCQQLKNCNRRGKCEIMGSIQRCQCVYGFLGPSCAGQPQNVTPGWIVPGGVDGTAEQYYMVPQSHYGVDTDIVVNQLAGYVNVFAAVGRVPKPTDFQFTSIGDETVPDQIVVHVYELFPRGDFIPGDQNLYVTVQGADPAGLNDFELHIKPKKEKKGPFGLSVGLGAFVVVVIVLVILAIIAGGFFFVYKKYLRQKWQERKNKLNHTKKMDQGGMSMQVVPMSAYGQTPADMSAAAGGSMAPDAYGYSMTPYQQYSNNANYDAAAYASAAYGSSYGSAAAAAYESTAMARGSAGTIPTGQSSAGGYGNMYANNYAGETSMQGSAYPMPTAMMGQASAGTVSGSASYLPSHSAGYLGGSLAGSNNGQYMHMGQGNGSAGVNTVASANFAQYAQAGYSHIPVY